MKLRNKLTLIFSSIVAVLLLGFAVSIYITYSEDREEEFYKRLKQLGMTKADLLIGAKINPQSLQLIYASAPNSYFQDEVAIYDKDFNLLYHDSSDNDKVKESKEMFERILKEKEIHFYTNSIQAVGFVYHHSGSDYIITAAAVDGYGLAILKKFKYKLAFGFLICVSLTFLAGKIFSIQALRPVTDLVTKTEEITAKNLDLRVNEGNGKDEISKLARTLNRMLDRLEKSFESQKHFVSHISHELRTPLSALITELEISKNKDRGVREYKQTISSALEDAKKIVRLINGLLDLAKANYDSSEIGFKSLRLDEILLDARQELIKQNANYSLNLHFASDFGDDLNFISILGNEYLLKVAFSNLMENGCKFSENKQSTVSINRFKEKTILTFTDNGVGIKESEIPKIFDSFYRGFNSNFASGNGIGLALVSRIVQLHGGTIAVKSEEGSGSSFIVELPHR
ncbi:HAMP domain-containing protein [Leptospira fletcheri]|uniref:histidine kinase n=1 Tax=Leptospira fletcheri TaxID=2484981 RepID=A0A4R9GEY7_9LEPT|nr:ATP-binding protein [Leptospira fletcheri]TGK10075.1 HAMP domain-containing protein [Leptospira fletcheri]